MRIGILTLHFSFNEGAIWQAYCSCKWLRKHLPNDTVEIIDLRPDAEMEERRRHYPGERQKLYPRVLKPLLSAQSCQTDDLSEAVSFIADNYDVCLVGSDLVWRFQRRENFINAMAKAWSLREPFYLKGGALDCLRRVKHAWQSFWGEYSQLRDANAEKLSWYWLGPEYKVKAYGLAASAGYLSKDQLSKGLVENMRASLDTYRMIGVREQNTKSLVEAVDPTAASRCELVPDPTWLYEDTPPDASDMWIEAGLADRPKVAGVLYPVHSRCGAKLHDVVMAWLREKGYVVVSVIDANSDVDVDLAKQAIHPFAWWNIIGRLDFFVTVRTHPTIAAIQNHTPFANFDITATDLSASTSKTQAMLSGFGLEDRCRFAPSDYTPERIKDHLQSSHDTTWDWDSIQSRREYHRDCLQSYLERVSKDIHA